MRSSLSSVRPQTATPAKPRRSLLFCACAILIAFTSQPLLSTVSAQEGPKEIADITSADFPDNEVIFGNDPSRKAIPLHVIQGHYFFFVANSETGACQSGSVLLSPQEDGMPATVTKSIDEKNPSRGIARTIVFRNSEHLQGHYLAVKWEGDSNITLYDIDFKLNHVPETTMSRDVGNIHERLVVKGSAPPAGSLAQKIDQLDSPEFFSSILHYKENGNYIIAIAINIAGKDVEGKDQTVSTPHVTAVAKPLTKHIGKYQGGFGIGIGGANIDGTLLIDEIVDTILLELRSREHESMTKVQSFKVSKTKGKF